MKSQLLKNTSLAALLVSFLVLQPGRVLAATTSTTIAVTNGVINFGAFIVLTGCANCTISISPTGVRSVTGAILLSNINAGSPATFSVTQTCDQSGPAPKCNGFTQGAVATAVLPAGGVNMTLSAFTFSPALPLTGSPPSITGAVSVGATLTIPSRGTAGTFSGGGFTFTTTP